VVIAKVVRLAVSSLAYGDSMTCFKEKLLAEAAAVLMAGVVLRAVSTVTGPLAPRRRCGRLGSL
jgi:hypothetical protein